VSESGVCSTHCTSRSPSGMIPRGLLSLTYSLGRTMNSSAASPSESVRITASVGFRSLPQTLATRHVALISLGGVIGAGLFVGSSVAIADAGPAIVLSYLLAGALLLLVMRMLGEMALARPDVRAFTDFVRAGLGHGAGFVVGWTYWYQWTVVIAIESIAGATLLQEWIPLPVWMLALTVIVLMWAINVLSTRTFAEFEFWFASVKVAAIIAFIAVVGSFVIRSLGHGPSSAGFHGLQAELMPYGVGSVITGITTVFFSLTGVETATIAAAESRESTRSMARMASRLIARIIVFYVLSVSLIVTVVPLRDIVPGISPFAVALRHLGFSWAVSATNLIVLTAVLSCLNSALYVSSRTLFTLAAHKDATPWLVGLNARQTPARAVTISMLVGTAGVALSAVSPERAFAFLVNASGAIILGIYLSVSLAYFQMRRSSAASSSSCWRLRPYPAVVYATVAGILIVLGVMARSKEMATQLYAGLVPLLVSYGAYTFLRRTRTARPVDVES
jgi:GABA permease